MDAAGRIGKSRPNRLSGHWQVGLLPHFGAPRPAFAYLQIASASTAKAHQIAVDGDPGYKLFLYRATDTEVVNVLKDLMRTGSLTIGYNRLSAWIVGANQPTRSSMALLITPPASRGAIARAKCANS